MKNIKFLLVLSVSMTLFACEPKPEPTAEELAETTGKTIRSLKDAFNKGYKDSVVSVPVINESEAHPYINPVLIYGSSFGNYFQALYKVGKFEDMIAFTSSRSIEKFGRDKVLSFYKSMDFAYKIKLKSMNVAETPVDATVLNYEAGIMATKNMLRMEVVIENDSCKILLKNLKSLR
jgi:hypothetical protein